MKLYRTYQVGFTLIEIVIVVAIVGILTAIALPAYTNFMIDARRSDAISFLTEVAGEQFRYYSDKNHYAGSMSDLGYGSAATFDSPEGYYEVSIDATGTTPRSFVIKATPKAGGSQENDTKCDVLSIDSSGFKDSTGTSTNCW